MQQQARQRRNNVVLRGTAYLALSIFFILPIIFAGAPHASASSGGIDATHKYAFSNVGGYVNFGTANGGVTVTDNILSGYAWSANDGWINLAPALSGVKNNGSGTLSGFAWDESAGWVNFTGVTIDSSGQFQGQATGGTVNGASYAINFDCTSCSVVTDWRPSSRAGFTGSISPIIVTTVTPPPPSASSTVPVVSLPSPLVPPRAPSGSHSGAPRVSSGAATSSQALISNSSNGTSITTNAFKNAVASSTAHAAMTTSKQSAAFSFMDLIYSLGQRIINFISLLVQTIFASISTALQFLVKL